MSGFNPALAAETMARLRRLGPARDRTVDRETRTITITDDEAVALVAAIDTLTGDLIAGAINNKETA